MLFESRLNQSSSEVKEWALKQIQEGYDDSAKLLDARIAEYDSGAKAADAGVRVRSSTPKPVEPNLRAEVIKLLEDERRLKNIRFDEIYQLIENNKQMQGELINQQFESQKALLKAIINKEIAERAAADEDIQASVSRQMTQFLQNQGQDVADLGGRLKA